MYNDAVFIQIVREKGLKVSAVARAMGIPPATLYRKRKQQSDFLRSEIQRCAHLFSPEELNAIFFASEVS